MANPFRRSANRTNTRKDIVRSSFVLNSDNLGSRVISGASFTFLGIALRTLITIGSMAILARLLTPADFGYIAMATVVTEFAAMFANFGFNSVLIQRRVITRLQLDTVFWASFLLGLALTLAVFALSFFADWFFAEPKTGELLRVLCLTFVIGSLTNVPWAILLRRMQFKIEFWIQISTVAFRALVAIVFAFYGYGVWSLVAGALAGSLMGVILNLLAVPYVPRLKFHLAYLTSTWKTSGSYFAGGLVFYAHMNIDLLLIGRQLGATPLGFYQNARSLTDEVRSRIAIPLQHVLFPAFSSIQTERERLQQLVIRGGSIIAAIIIPVGVGISAVAEELVPVLYGDQWIDMIPVLVMLGLSAALRGATAIVTPLFNAQNRVGLGLKYGIYGTMLMVFGVLITLPYGVQAVATAIAITSIYSLFSFRAGLGLIGLGVKHEMKILGPPAIAAFVMWTIITNIRPLVTSQIGSLGLQLFLHVAVGAVVYSVTLHLLSRTYLKEFRGLVKKLVGVRVG